MDVKYLTFMVLTFQIASAQASITTTSTPKSTNATESTTTSSAEITTSPVPQPLACKCSESTCSLQNKNSTQVLHRFICNDSQTLWCCNSSVSSSLYGCTAITDHLQCQRNGNTCSKPTNSSDSCEEWSNSTCYDKCPCGYNKTDIGCKLLLTNASETTTFTLELTTSVQTGQTTPPDCDDLSVNFFTKGCPGPNTLFFIIIACSFFLLLLIVIIPVSICCCKRKKTCCYREEVEPNLPPSKDELSKTKKSGKRHLLERKPTKPNDYHKRLNDEEGRISPTDDYETTVLGRAEQEDQCAGQDDYENVQMDTLGHQNQAVQGNVYQEQAVYDNEEAFGNDQQLYGNEGFVAETGFNDDDQPMYGNVEMINQQATNNQQVCVVEEEYMDMDVNKQSTLPNRGQANQPNTQQPNRGQASQPKAQQPKRAVTSPKEAKPATTKKPTAAKPAPPKKPEPNDPCETGDSDQHSVPADIKNLPFFKELKSIKHLYEQKHQPPVAAREEEAYMYTSNAPTGLPSTAHVEEAYADRPFSPEYSDAQTVANNEEDDLEEDDIYQNVPAKKSNRR